MLAMCIQACLILSAVALVTGCTTPRTQQRQVQTHTNLENLQHTIEQLRERLEAGEQRQEHLAEALDSLRRELGQARGEYDDGLHALARRLDELDAARAEDRQQVINRISEQVAAMLKQNRAAVNARRTESGFGHVVASGQTLSEIAKAYNVDVSVITKANGISDPNSIRVGQELFIPEQRR